MRVRQQRGEDGFHRVELLDEGGEPVEVVSGFLRFLAARDCPLWTSRFSSPRSILRRREYPGNGCGPGAAP